MADTRDAEPVWSCTAIIREQADVFIATNLDKGVWSLPLICVNHTVYWGSQKVGPVQGRRPP